MVRGRKKDLTVPPTRQLTLQRDYRARKARYITELEQRCLKAEEENTRLRRELELARAAMPFTSPHEVVQVSSELLRDLASASASIARFQEITAPRVSTPTPDANSLHRQQSPIPSYSQSLAASSSTALPSVLCQVPPQPVTPPSLQVHALHEPTARLTLPYRVLSPIQVQSNERTPTSSSASSQPSGTSAPSPESECCGGYVDCSSECCGGYLDCSELVEEEDEGHEEGGDSGRNSTKSSRA